MILDRLSPQKSLIVAAYVLGISSHLLCAQSPNQPSRMEGVFLQGRNAYTLNTDKSEPANADAVVHWKQNLRKIQSEERDSAARNSAGKKLRIEEIQQRQRMREIQQWTNASSEEIQTGQALNILLYDLTDPDIPLDDWSSKLVPLPKGMSIKDLSFRFTPANNATGASKVLAKGVIALSLLDMEGKWPAAMKFDALQEERTAYEKACRTLRDQLVNDKFELTALLALDRALESLKAKVQMAVPKERGIRVEATKFVEELKNATRFIDATTSDYVAEFLRDVQDREPETVGELVGFMVKYRLQFATAERSPVGRVLYGQLYESLQEQVQALGIEPPRPLAQSDLDRIATGKWIRLVDAKTALTDPQKMRFENGILELDHSPLRFPKIIAADVILRAQVCKVSGQNVAISIRYSESGQLTGWCNGADADGGDAFGIWQRTSINNVNFPKDLAGTHTGQKLQTGQFVEMAFAAIGDSLTIYVEGSKAVSVKNGDVARGSFCLGTSKGKNFFKNVEYQILDPVPIRPRK